MADIEDIEIADIPEIEKNSLLEAIAEFNNNKSDLCIRFYQRLDSAYTAYSSDAVCVAEILYGSSSTCKTLTLSGVREHYITVNHNKFEKLVRDLLLSKRYIVELYRDNPKCNPRFTLLGRGSPGNLDYFEDIIYRQAEFIDSGVICACQINVTDSGLR
ncbi:hypothetical protein MXB_5066, partial [Myxobolus squamalis]